MVKLNHSAILQWGLMVCLVFPLSRVQADHHPQEVHADGLTLHWGVVSAEKAEGNPEVGPPVTGSVKDKYHLVVAVFENQSGLRVADAKVSAKVGRVGHLLPPEKYLHMINANGVVSYGNYFGMAKGKTQTITVRVERTGANPVEMKFRYEPK